MWNHGNPDAQVVGFATILSPPVFLTLDQVWPPANHDLFTKELRPRQVLWSNQNVRLLPSRHREHDQEIHRW
jgi:hypothetical protein